VSPTARDITDPLLETYTPVPHIGPGVCSVCHGAPNEGYERCYSCQEAMRKVTHPLDLIVPISLSKTDEQLHHVLRSYKSSPFPEVRRRFTMQIAAMIARFLGSHQQCIVSAAGTAWDTVTIVPSTAGRVGRHPLLDVIEMVKILGPAYVDLLTPGTTPLGHNVSDDAGLVASHTAAGRAVLLIDDTFTTGARAQSAASALTLAGATVVSALVVGRVINPDWSTASKELWERARAIPFSFDLCCLE